jgi:hypothetical protein
VIVIAGSFHVQPGNCFGRSVSAGAGLVGATIGGAMSFLGSWIVHQRQIRAQWLGQDRLRRQNLYKEFIQEASKCYVHALQNEKPNVPSLVVLYGKISRMRVISSPQVLAAAEQVLRRIVDVYFKPPRLSFSRCSKMDQSMSFETSANVVEPNSTCSGLNNFEAV